jgi:hypothetical protein
MPSGATMKIRRAIKILFIIGFPYAYVGSFFQGLL